MLKHEGASLSWLIEIIIKWEFEDDIYLGMQEIYCHEIKVAISDARVIS